MTSATATYSTGLARARRVWAIVLASLALLVLLGSLTAAIMLSQQQSRSHLLGTFGLRGTTSATFVSDFLAQQTTREQRAAEQFLSGRRVSAERFRVVVAAFGSSAAVLLDSAGRLLDVVPSDPALLGRRIAAKYAHLMAAEHGRIAVSNVVALFGRSLSDSARLTVLSATLEKTAQTDSLTGLFNRRALSMHLTRTAAHARRRATPLSVLMIDLDRFKQTNDRFGHEAGDQVLCALAECMREAFRADDIYGRWGGDEFLVLLPATDQQEAQIAAERLRDHTRKLRLEDIGLSDGIPLSVGIATAIHASPTELVRAADTALYRAKTTSHAELDLSAGDSGYA